MGKPNDECPLTIDYLPIPNNNFTFDISAVLTVTSPVRPRFCLVVFLVRIWFLKAWALLILPLGVTLKRLAAARLVFIFGISVSYYFLFCYTRFKPELFYFFPFGLISKNIFLPSSLGN